MTINNKDYGFKLTVGASVQIARLCPNGDLSRIGEAVGGEYGNTVEAMCEIITALNNGFAASEEFEGREANRIKKEELFSLSPSDFMEVQTEAMKAFGIDISGEIEVKSTKKAEAEG